MYLQLLQTLGWALLNSFWQMALLWVVYQLVSLFLQKTKATQRATLASTLLLMILAKLRWRLPAWQVWPLALVFLAVELAFFSANV